MNTDSFDKDKTLDQENALQPKMVTVEIDGKPHQVPAGITLMKALWYTGHEVTRGAGCLGGFCGPVGLIIVPRAIPRLKPVWPARMR